MKKKIDIFLWAFMWLLPFLVFFVNNYANGGTLNFNTFVNEVFAWSFIQNIFDGVWNTAFNSTLPISGYLSYLVLVETVHCVFDAVVFIPRLCHSFIGWLERKGGLDA